MSININDLPPKVQRMVASQEKRKRTAGTYRLEKDLVKDTLAMLGEMGIFAWRNNSGGLKRDKGFVRFGLTGSADILGVISPSGKFLAVECKARLGKPTPAQERFIEQIRSAGGIAGVCWTLDDVRNLIERGQADD